MRGKAKRIPVVMCTWQRIEHLPRTIAMLERQRGVERPLLCVWNNNTLARDEIDRILASAKTIETRVHHSDENIGGEGRFRLARRLAPDEPFVIFIDDDVVFANDWGLAGFTREATPGTMRSHWSWRFRPGGNYWDRDRAMPGEPAHYTGVAGFVADTAVFLRDDTLECPDRYRFIEDVWLCYIAHHRMGWDLRASITPVLIHDDGKDQFRALGDKKSEFLDLLRRQYGWQV